jgi:hypothetical protein
MSLIKAKQAGALNPNNSNIVNSLAPMHILLNANQGVGLKSSADENDEQTANFINSNDRMMIMSSDTKSR